MLTGELTLEDAAHEAAGNWQKFDSFCWFRRNEIEDPDNWGIDYPVLDEEDYSNRELEATLDNLTDAAWRLKDEYELPEGWEGEVYGWLSDNNCGAIENRDDQGGYPSEEELQEAFDALGYAMVP